MNKIEEARQLLTQAGLFFYDDENNDPSPKNYLNLKMRAIWACSDTEFVPDEEMLELRRLFLNYGFCGVYYWVFKQRGLDAVEFADVNRFVQFVREEEAIRAECPSGSAYLRRSYTVG